MWKALADGSGAVARKLKPIQELHDRRSNGTCFAVAWRVSVCLKGSLDDFSIPDILQIISFGRKTGCLSLETPAAGGTVVFRRGRILASVDDGGPSRETELESVRGYQRDEVIRKRIAASLDRLARCRQGDFSFQVSAQPPQVVAGRDIALETLDTGIEVIELLLELVGTQGWEAAPGAPATGARWLT